MLNLECDNISEQRDNDSQSEDKKKKYYSILPDLATGWRPKNLKIAAPILITYQESLNLSVYQHFIGQMNRLIYIGPRYENSYKFHSLTPHGYTIKYGLNYDDVPSKLQKELEQFTLKRNGGRKTPFQGMNPYLPAQLRFESNFQSGNLDLVVKVSDNEYNLFLRPDTNTQGHMQWFYFRVTNHFRCRAKTVKFNICNNKKALTLFKRGMKPFILSKQLQKTKNLGWHQAGFNVSYEKLSTKECFNKEMLNVRTDCCFQNEDLEKYYCLSFQYAFQDDQDEVSFAYCPPYTYTEMREHVDKLKKITYTDITCSFNEETLCSSMSGLQIPVLTITDQAYPDQGKRCVVAMARIHPGQSNGSYVMKGFLEFLVSAEAEGLRKKIVFKVIPMMNPDGVVFGNYRTSLSGKDLNRKFKAKSQQIFPEIIYLKEFVSKLKKESQMKLVYFLDFHGHSMKKNVFTYGPEYDLWTSKYQKSKVFPRILALKSNMFRLQSCLFRVALGKKTTARAFMLSLIPYCYTIESSVGMFRSFDESCNRLFDPAKWEEMGYIIGDGLKDTLKKIFQDMAVKEKEKGKKKNNQKIVTPLIKSRNQVESADQNNKENLDQSKKKIKRVSSSTNLSRSISNHSLHRKKEKEIQKSKGVKIPVTSLNFQIPQINEVQEKHEESDGYSEGMSDCESDEDDFNKEEYKQLSGKIMKFIESFNNFIVGLKRNKIKIKYRPKKKRQSLNKTRTMGIATKKNFEQLKFVPSLRYKINKKDLSQKKINFEDRDKDISILRTNKISLMKHEDDRKKKGNNSTMMIA